MSETQSFASEVSRVEASLNNGRDGNSPQQNQTSRTPRRQRRQRQAKKQQGSSSNNTPSAPVGRSTGSRNRAVRPPAAVKKNPSLSSPGYGSRHADANAGSEGGKNFSFPLGVGTGGGKNPSLSSSGGEARVSRLDFNTPDAKFRVSTSSTGEPLAPKFRNRRRKAKAFVRRLVDNPQSFSVRESPPQIPNFPRPPISLGQQLPENPAKGVRSPNLGVKNSKIKPNQEAKPKSQTNTRTQNPPRSFSPLVYGTRLLIIGVGIGALAGTLLSALDPASRLSASSHGVKQEAAKVEAQSKQSQSANSQSANFQSSLKLGQEISSMKAQVAALVKQNPKLQPGVFLVDLDTGAYLDSEGNSTFPAASTIKLPILVAFFQDVDAGKIRLEEQLTLKPELIGSGSGDLQYKKPGTKFTALEVVTKMIAISDNTATNMLIARLGGAAALNRRFVSWGLTSTVINNALPDLEGTNTTSPKELATVMGMINQGDVVSMESRSLMLEILQKTVTNSMLPKGLGKGATIAHKTGDIGSLVGDVGLINTPTGKRYIAAVMVKRPYNDAHAQELIRQISRTAYQNLSGEQSAASTQKSPQKPQESGIRNQQ